jgi:uncharacterized protein (DUF779 family)
LEVQDGGGDGGYGGGGEVDTGIAAGARAADVHQSGGCCDGSVPLCFRLGEFRVGSRDVLFGTVEDTPFYVGHAQAEYLSRTQLVLDVIPGDIDSFSLEAGTGVRFLSRSKACAVEITKGQDEEAVTL